MCDDGERLSVVLSGGAPWGFRLQGGREFRSPLQIAKVTAGGKAQKASLKEGDCLTAINGHNCEDCLHNDALQKVKSAKGTLTLSILRGAKSKRASGAARAASPSGKVAPPWSRSTPSSTSSTSSTSRPESESSAGHGQRPASSTSDSGIAFGDREGSASSQPTSPAVDVASPDAGAARDSTPVADIPAANHVERSESAARRSSGSTGADGEAVFDGASPRASASSVADLVPVQGGQKEKGWYKQMFKTIHGGSSGADETGTSTTSQPAYNYDSRKSLPTSSATKPIPKWQSSRPASTSSANVANSAKTFEQRRASASTANTSGSTLPRRGTKDPPPSVSARADFFRKKEVASKDSGLSPSGSHARRGVGVVSPASTWSQRKAAESTSPSHQPSQPSQPSQPWRPPTAVKTVDRTSSLPRTAKLESSSADSNRRSTPSPRRITPEPKPSEGYNNLNAALSDLNEAISSLEVATTSAAQKEGKKKTPWQPSEAPKSAAVLHAQPNDHQTKIEDVLGKKLMEGGQAPVRAVEEVKCAPKQPTAHVINFPPQMTEVQQQQQPVARSPSPPPAAVPVPTKPSSPPPPAPAAVAKPPSTRVTIEPEAVVQLQPPVEAFVINLPPPEPEQPAADERSGDVAKDIDDLLEAHIQAQAPMPQQQQTPRQVEEQVLPPPPQAIVTPAPVEPSQAREPTPEPEPVSAPAPVAVSAPAAAPVVVTQQAEPSTEPVGAASSDQSSQRTGEEEQDGPQSASSDLPPVPDLEPGQGYGLAVYSFTPQGKREIALKRGDHVVLTRRVDANWLEGIVGGVKGIFPSTYVKVALAPTQRKTSTTSRTPEPQVQASSKTASPEPAQEVQVREKKADGSNGLAKARYSFQAENTRELSLTKGAEITLIRRVDRNWYEGMIMPGLKGIIPASYLEVIDDVPQMKRVSTADLQGADGKKSPPDRPSSGPKKPTYSPPAAPVAAVTSSASSISNTSPAHSSGSAASKDPGKRFRALYAYAPLNGDELELREGDIIYVLEQCSDGWFVGTSDRTDLFGTFPGNYVTPAMGEA